MALIINYPVPYTPATEQSFTRFAEVPPFVSCPQYPILNFTSSLGQQWNCQLCAHQPYFSLYEFGDIIPLQFNLPDVRNAAFFGSIAQPNIGWRQTDLLNNFWYIRAEIYDGSTTSPTLIYSLVDQFCSDWWVGYSNLVGSVQTLFIDTAMLPLGTTTFRVKIVTIDAAGADDITIWSEPFCVGAGCSETLIVSGEYATKDCYNRDYREPNTTTLKWVHTPFNASNPVGYVPTRFYTSWRYSGVVVSDSFASENELNDLDRVVRSKSIETYRLILSEAIPPYVARILAATLQGSRFAVDGITYNTATQVSKNILGTLAFLPNIELTKTCQINNNQCD
jgi:hypothetical protein